MQRIQGSTVEADKFGAGKPGFSEGNAETQRPATIVSAQFLDALQEEIVRAIEQSGQVPDAANLNQLAQAIAQAAASGPTSSPGIDPTTLLARVNEWTGGGGNDYGNTFKNRTLFETSPTVRGAPEAPAYFRGDTFRTHKKLIPLTAFDCYVGTGFAMQDDDGIRLQRTGFSGTFPNSSKIDLNAFIPRGAQINGITCGVRSSSNGGAARMNMRMQRLTLVMTGDGGPNTQQQLFSVTASKNGDAIISAPPMSVTVHDTHVLRLVFQGNTEADFNDPDRIRWLQVSYAGWFGDEYL